MHHDQCSKCLTELCSDRSLAHSCHMYFRTWCRVWLLLTLVGVTMASLAYFVKGIATLLKIHRRSVVEAEDSPRLVTYLLWVLEAMALTMFSIEWTKRIAPAAAGSGIPEMRLILSGVVIEAYISLQV